MATADIVSLVVTAFQGGKRVRIPAMTRTQFVALNRLLKAEMAHQAH